MELDKPGRVLLVDDEEVIRDLVSAHLTEQGLECVAAKDGRSALALAEQQYFDVVLTDVHMPGLDGLALIRELQTICPALPVIVVTALSSFDTAVRALRHGAFDYIVKPFQLDTLDDVISRGIERRRAMDDITWTSDAVEAVVAKRMSKADKRLSRARRQIRRLRSSNDQLRSVVEETVQVWVETLESRGLEPRNHCRRVRAYGVLAARQLGLSSRELRDVSWGTLLHHVGFLSLPETIVLADHRETTALEMYESHAMLGARMLRGIGLLAGAAKIVAAHHEHFDGSGGPRGLGGEDIPIGARCLAVADAADAILSRHAHGSTEGTNAVVHGLRAGAGTLYDPEVVRAFLRIPRRHLDRERRRFPPEGSQIASGPPSAGVTTGEMSI